MSSSTNSKHFVVKQETYMNFIFFVFIIKILFVLFFILKTIYKFRIKNPSPTELHYLKIITYWTNVFEIGFRVLITGLILYLFTPNSHTHRIKQINYETALLIYIYGWILVMELIRRVFEMYKNT